MKNNVEVLCVIGMFGLAFFTGYMCGRIAESTSRLKADYPSGNHIIYNGSGPAWSESSRGPFRIYAAGGSGSGIGMGGEGAIINGNSTPRTDGGMR